MNTTTESLKQREHRETYMYDTTTKLPNVPNTPTNTPNTTPDTNTVPPIDQLLKTYNKSS